MCKIEITRDSNDTVHFQTISIPETENVFFLNLDPKEAHHPSLLPHPLGPAPSPTSIGAVPHSPYTCLIHPGEQGTIDIVPIMNQENADLAPATAGQPIDQQQVVSGGKFPYQISAANFEVRSSDGAVIQSGAGIGPGLQLITNNNGVSVQGTPTISGTYKFIFDVDDAISQNLQQLEYQMAVA